MNEHAINDEGLIIAGLWELTVAIEGAGRYYKKKTSKPLVFVVDNCNRLAVEFPKAFNQLQDWAKDMADRGFIRVVFVSSGGVAPRVLQCKKISFVMLSS